MNSKREIRMMATKLPLPGEVLSENHHFLTSPPPYPRILDSRRENEEAPKVLLKTQSLRIENSEPPDPLVTNSPFSRAEGNKKPPRHSKITQPLRIENSEPSALSSINIKSPRGEEREDRSVQDAPEATPLVRVVCSVVW